MRARIESRVAWRSSVAVTAVLVDVLELRAEGGFYGVPVSVERGQRLVTR